MLIQYQYRLAFCKFFWNAAHRTLAVLKAVSMTFLRRNVPWYFSRWNQTSHNGDTILILLFCSDLYYHTLFNNAAYCYTYPIFGSGLDFAKCHDSLLVSEHKHAGWENRSGVTSCLILIRSDGRSALKVIVCYGLEMMVCPLHITCTSCMYV